MKRIFLSACVCLFLMMSIACSEKNAKYSIDYKPDSTGRIDEVILVMDEMKWQQDLGEKVRDVFMGDYAVLPQSEPIFDLRQVPYESLVNVELLRRASTMLFIGTLDGSDPTSKYIQKQLSKYSSKQTKNGYFIKKNMWSNPQQVIFVYADTEDALKELLLKQSAPIFTALYKVENKKAYNNMYVPGISEGATKILREKFKLDLAIPKTFQEALSTENMIWFRQDNVAAEEVSNIMISIEPYEENNAPVLSGAYPIEKRNKLGILVSSEVKDSYMSADNRFIPFEQTYTTIDGFKTLETRGLWRMEKDFMGGPFLNYCFDDTANNRIVCIDGFVYAPKHDKRPIIRKLEAMLKRAKVVRGKVAS